MFTGIIEETGTIQSINTNGHKKVLRISAEKVLQETKIGSSIAVNGVCLTVTSNNGKDFSADIMPETLERSSLASMKSGSPVNLERALQVNGRLDGHMVTGHIDGTGRLTAIYQDSNAVRLQISAPAHICSMIVEKGSVALDGISLTVCKVAGTSFEVSIIPHTYNLTSLESCKKGTQVNIETDIIGKYLYKYILSNKSSAEYKELLIGGKNYVYCD